MQFDGGQRRYREERWGVAIALRGKRLLPRRDCHAALAMTEWSAHNNGVGRSRRQSGAGRQRQPHCVGRPAYSGVTSDSASLPLSTRRMLP